ncbi:MAG TPA: manganese efflux pump [Chloroflexota bacterium]|nr:manganese efflux pump [Chloroflexota bacterium]
MSTGLDLRVIPLILALGLDTFALSTTLGIAPLSRRARLRLALTFAAAEGLMPAVGLLIGRPLGEAVGRWDVYAAAALLLVTGLWMLREGLAEDDGRSSGDERAQALRLASAQGLSLVGLALSVSLDELAVGFSFGILRIALLPALVAIALQALLLSLCGLWLGRRVGRALGERAEMLSGVVLCLLGIALGVGRLMGLTGA